MKKTELERIFKVGIQNENYSHVCVYVSTPSLPEVESIINPRVNMESKLEYYLNAYDDDLKLKANPEITIEDVYLFCTEKDEWV